MSSELLKAGKEVLRKEAEAITEVMERLGPEFDQVVKTINACSGRVVFTGIGKSGLIAKKIGSISELQKFEPMRDAIAFRKGSIRVKAETRYKLEMNGRIFGPYGGEIEVPMYAAVYLHLKGLAKLVVGTASG